MRFLANKHPRDRVKMTGFTNSTESHPDSFSLYRVDVLLSGLEIEAFKFQSLHFLK